MEQQVGSTLSKSSAKNLELKAVPPVTHRASPALGSLGGTEVEELGFQPSRCLTRSHPAAAETMLFEHVVRRLLEFICGLVSIPRAAPGTPKVCSRWCCHEKR